MPTRDTNLLFDMGKFDYPFGLTTLQDKSRNKSACAMTAITSTRLATGIYVPTFNGTTSFIATNNANSVKGKAQVSLSVWFNTAVLDGVNRILYVEPITASTNARFALRIDADSRLLFQGRSSDGDGLTTWVDSTKTLIVSVWYHAVFVFDSISDNHFIYLNTLPETANIAATPFTNSNPNYVPDIGRSLFFGMLSHLKLYSVALSAPQVYSIFISERRNFGV
jgi:hypothetical protein